MNELLCLLLELEVSGIKNIDNGSDNGFDQEFPFAGRAGEATFTTFVLSIRARRSGGSIKVVCGLGNGLKGSQ